MRQRKASLFGTRRRGALYGVLLACLSLGAILVPPAWGNVGYQLDSTKSSRALGGVVKGLAIDQTTQDIYAAITTTSPLMGKPGEIERFNSDLSADKVFAAGKGFYTGVAVDPLTHNFYTAQVEIRTGFGNVGTPQLDLFSSTGTSLWSVPTAYSDSFQTLATDSNGNAFLPNVDTHSVLVYNSGGILIEIITCSDCPGGSFGKPSSVAVDSSDNLYVADVAPDRVMKLTYSGSAYTYSSTVQSGRGAGSVGVDPVTGDILVGDMPDGKNFHIVAYTPSGIQFDDFGAGLFSNGIGNHGALFAYPIVVNATTHKLYVSELEKFYVFEKTTIPPPSVTATPASDAHQLGATLNASVNANGHAVLDCTFEYTDEADFQANAFSNAVNLPCAEKPNGSANRQLDVDLTTLAPATAYRFRVTAESNAGSTSGGSQTFETLPEVPPTVVSKPPQAVGQGVATLAGEINPHGGTASDCHFEFGTSASYGSSIPCEALPGPVTTNLTETEKISGLTPGTKYHYRLVFSTNAGTNAGDDIEFTTTSPAHQDPGPQTQPTEPAGPVTGPPETPSTGSCKVGFRRERIHGELRCVKVCKKGFRRKMVRGKVRCVKKVHHPKRSGGRGRR